MQKHASQVLIHQKRASQVLINQKNVQKRAKRASQIFLDPIQKRASSRSMQLEAVLFKALLYQDFNLHLVFSHRLMQRSHIPDLFLQFQVIYCSFWLRF